ncbi:hypothetical protein Pelo_13284 [Pelomyxa schiedti]|nr:hypothetical protein Pelo_13284 [Pelomyxa schiedti]
MPPEVSQFTKTLTTTQTTFSYTKCDSFALAFTFYDLLLPESAPLPLTTSTNNDRSAFDPLQLHPLPEWCSRFGTDILIPMMSHNRKTRMSATTALSLLS